MNYTNPTKIDSISVALGGVAATQALPLLEAWIKVPVVPVVLAAALSIITFQTLKYLLNRFPKRFAFTRRWVDSKAKFEGFFLETKNTQGGETYSIFTISYDYPQNEYVISGIGIENNGIVFQWKSTSVFIDVKNNKVSYSTEGRATKSGNAQNFEGITFLNFDHTSKNLNYGLGHFIDSLPAFADFAFERIKKEDCQKYIAKNKIEDVQDYINYVGNYIQSNPTKSFTP